MFLEVTIRGGLPGERDISEVLRPFPVVVLFAPAHFLFPVVGQATGPAVGDTDLTQAPCHWPVRIFPVAIGPAVLTENARYLLVPVHEQGATPDMPTRDRSNVRHPSRSITKGLLGCRG